MAISNPPPARPAGASPVLRRALGFAAAFLACHAIAIGIFPAQAQAVSFAFLVLAPLMAAAACLARAARTRIYEGWLALGLAMLCWSGGMAATMLGTTVFSTDAVAAIGMFLFVLYGAPIVFVTASPHDEAWPVRAADGVLALILSCLFFAYVFSVATPSGTDEAGVLKLRLLLDIQNIVILGFAALRYRASVEPRQRSFFGVLTLFAAIYAVTAGYINHFQDDSDYGVFSDLAIDIPFLTLAALASIAPQAGTGSPQVSRAFLRAVRAGESLMLPLATLTVSGLLVLDRPGLAVAGCIAVMLGYGVRTILIQLRDFDEKERLETLSLIDPLTGLPNRRQFIATFDRAWAHARRTGDSLSLLMIDIDHFKQLNDGYGHMVGDERLREVARALSGCLKRETDLLARYGGEEFTAILPSIGSVDAWSVAQSMRAAVQTLGLPSPAPPGVVTVSIGISHMRRVTGDVGRVLVEAADAALYETKSKGRNGVTIYETDPLADLADGIPGSSGDMMPDGRSMRG